MDGLKTYGNTSEEISFQQVYPDSGLSVNIQDSSLFQDSVAFQQDSLLLTPTDSLFRFWQVQPEKRIYFTDPTVRPDSTYAERIMWKGLKMYPHKNDYSGNDWLTGVLFFALIILASVGAGYSKYIGSLFHSLINYSTSFRMFREKNYSILHGAFRLEALFYIVFSVFIFQIIVMASSNTSLFNFWFFIETLAAVVFYFLAKKLAYRALGSIFINTSDVKEFLFNMDNFNRGAGIILLPVVALIAYYPFENSMFAVFLGVLTTLVFYIMLLKRGISILLKKQFPIFYLFLYLCTLEILPLLLIYKLAVD